MYVHEKNRIYIANRKNEKLPHPTLVGGDPDVKGAGTMELKSPKEIIITNESGHFRPSGIHSDTIGIVKKIVGKTMKVNKRKAN